MRASTLTLLTLLIVGTWHVAYAAPLIRGSNAAASRRIAMQPFVVYDSLSYSGKPDLRVYGLTPIAGTGELWRGGTPGNSVDAIGLRDAIAFHRRKSDMFYLDIEHWPVLFVPQRIRDENVSKFVDVAKRVRQLAPDLRFGFYGILPSITYWPLVVHDEKLKQWHDANRDMEQLAQYVDAVFPSLYTFYDDQLGWESYARQTLKEARRYGKPVYAFLWPEYHNSNSLLRGQNISREFWRLQLDLCLELADGVVIWGGWQRPWDPRAKWWLETIDFIQSSRQ